MNRKRHKRNGTHRIPSRGGRESTCFKLAAHVRTRFDVRDALDESGVQQGIEETKWTFVFESAEVIKQRDYARHCLDVGSQLGA